MKPTETPRNGSLSLSLSLSLFLFIACITLRFRNHSLTLSLSLLLLNSLSVPHSPPSSTHNTDKQSKHATRMRKSKNSRTSPKMKETFSNKKPPSPNLQGEIPVMPERSPQLQEIPSSLRLLARPGHSWARMISTCTCAFKHSSSFTQGSMRPSQKFSSLIR